MALSAVVLPSQLVDKVSIQGTGRASLRDQPAPSATTIGFMKPGSEAKVVEASGTWVRVTSSGNTGWLGDHYVRSGIFSPATAIIAKYILAGIAGLVFLAGLHTYYVSPRRRRLQQANREFNEALRNGLPWWKELVGVRPAIPNRQIGASSANTEQEKTVPGRGVSSQVPAGIEGASCEKPGSEAREKGARFEKFIAKQFQRASGFNVIEWRGDKGFDVGVYVQANTRPDIEVTVVQEGVKTRFAVECKYRSRLLSNGYLSWANGEAQARRYTAYQVEHGIPVFVAVGLGGRPEAPRLLYVIPLDVLREHSESMNGITGLVVRIDVIAEYTCNPRGRPRIDAATGRLVFR